MNGSSKSICEQRVLAMSRIIASARRISSVEKSKRRCETSTFDQRESTAYHDNAIYHSVWTCPTFFISEFNRHPEALGVAGLNPFFSSNHVSNVRRQTSCHFIRRERCFSQLMRERECYRINHSVCCSIMRYSACESTKSMFSVCRLYRSSSPQLAMVTRFCVLPD